MQLAGGRPLLSRNCRPNGRLDGAVCGQPTEDGIGHPYGRREELEGNADRSNDGRHYGGAQDAQREQEWEAWATHEVGLEQGRDKRQRESEPDEVRPIFLDEREPPVQLPAAAEPGVLEGVERVQHAQVNQAGQFVDPWDGFGQGAEEQRLEQEQCLNQNTEQNVWKDAAQTGQEPLATAGGVTERYVRNVLEPEAVHHFAQQEQW